MTTENEELNTYEFQSFDPFPQPQTYPTGWDLSELVVAPKPVEASKSSEEDGKNVNT